MSEENASEIRAYRKGVTDKYLDRRLHAVQLLGEGMKPKDIAEKLDADKRQISRWASQFCNGDGIKGLIPKVGGRYRENMTFDEETELLKQFEELQAKQAEADAIIKAQVELKKAEMLEKAKALSFVTEEDHEMLVDFMLEKANESVVALLEKAQARIAELETEVEKTKEEFATAEHGKDGEPIVDDVQKSAEEILAENVAKAIAAKANK